MYILKNIFYEYGADVTLNLGRPNSVLIKNTGDVKMWVNGFPLTSGETFTSNLLAHDMIDKTLYKVRFDPAGTGTKLVNIIASFVNQENVKLKDGTAC